LEEKIRNTQKRDNSISYNVEGLRTQKSCCLIIDLTGRAGKGQAEKKGKKGEGGTKQSERKKGGLAPVKRVLGRSKNGPYRRSGSKNLC